MGSNKRLLSAPSRSGPILPPMSQEQVKAFYAHVWPIFWPVLWWNLIVYRAWRAELRERGFDGNICLAVARWGQLVITYIEPPRPDVPEYQGLSQRYRAHIERLSTDLTGTGRPSGDAEPGLGLRAMLMRRVVRSGSGSRTWPGAGSLRGSVIYPVPFLDSS